MDGKGSGNKAKINVDLKPFLMFQIQKKNKKMFILIRAIPGSFYSF